MVCLGGRVLSCTACARQKSRRSSARIASGMLLEGTFGCCPHTELAAKYTARSTHNEEGDIAEQSSQLKNRLFTFQGTGLSLTQAYSKPTPQPTPQPTLGLPSA